MIASRSPRTGRHAIVSRNSGADQRVETTVVVPLHDKARTVGRCLTSILTQSYRDFELLVIDDGSTDGGGETAAAIVDPRLRVVRQTREGPGAARNHGVRLAEGEYIAFLDADDEWIPYFLEENLALLEANRPAAFVTSAYFEYPGGSAPLALWLRRGIREGPVRTSPRTSVRALAHRLAFMTPCTTLLRTGVVRRWGGFHEGPRAAYGEDAHLWLKVLLNESGFMSLVPRTRVHREDSALSRRDRPRGIETFLDHPEDVRAACPPRLRPLLEELLAHRAFKTASVLGYWGEWRQARALVQRYYRQGGWRLPYFAPSLVAATPVAGVVGRAWRRGRGIDPGARPGSKRAESVP